MDNAYVSVDENEQRQDRFVMAGSVLSPFLAFRDFSMRLTATDMRVHQDFTDKAEIHRRKMGVLVNDFYQKTPLPPMDFGKQCRSFRTPHRIRRGGCPVHSVPFPYCYCGRRGLRADALLVP